MRVSSSGAFKDLFSAGSKDYARFRPTYPPELFDWIAAQAPQPRHAVDVGTGNGQAAVALADRFERVTGIDPSEAQLRQAAAHPRVQYVAAPAEATRLPDGSADALTVAQALHWFDVDAFYSEARRVGRPGALLAVWNYPRPRFVDAALERVFLDFYSNVVGPYWPAGRRHIEANYTTLPFPFREIPHPEFGHELDWPFEQVIGYVSSWSATAQYRKALGTDPVPLLRASLGAVWPAGGGTARVRIPLGLRVAPLHG